MNLTCFKLLYASTFEYENALLEFWNAFVYDVDGSLDNWMKMKEKIEQNACDQRKQLKEMFDASLPKSEKDAYQMAAAGRELYMQLMDEYPELQNGNEKEYEWFSKETV